MMRLTNKYYQKIIMLILVFQFTACSSNDPDSFEKIDPENYYYFNEGDTLRYISESGIDSFVVVKAERYMSGSIEQFDIQVSQLNNSTNVYSGGYQLYFDAYNFKILFRNITYENRSYMYKPELIDSTNLIYGRKVNYLSTVFYNSRLNNYPVELLDENVANLYFSYNYGLIKYELKNGETFTIDEELLRR